jgi:uncharacterized membrane protein
MSEPHAAISLHAFQRSPLERMPSQLPWIFLLFASPLVIFLAIYTPAFQSADEINHFYRANQIAHGGLISSSAGGYADSSIAQLYAFMLPIQFHPQEHMSAADVAFERSIHWSGKSIYCEFINTVTGAPTGYVPQALAVLIGQMLGLSVLKTLILARLINGFVAIAICAYALSICRRGRVFMFALLLLPMTLSLFASASQDATLIALACLAFSLVSRQLGEGKPMSRNSTLVVLLSLLVVCLGRPPYVTLLLVLFIPGLLPRWRNASPRLVALALVTLISFATVAWWLISTGAARALAHPHLANGNFDAKLQLLNLLHHPSIVAALVAYIVRHTAEYISGTIGILGWLDTPMPGLYYLAMIVVLAAAAVAEASSGPRSPKGVTPLLLWAACASVACVFAIEYLIWTPVGAVAIYGVQGRYFIPLLIAAAVGLPQLGDSEKAYERITTIVVAAQLITVVVLPQVIFARYYGG